MKKTVMGFGLAAILGCAGVARADGYGMAGCGLGSLLFGNDDSKLMQILAATTNGTVGSQTFGITSGTLNCTSGGVVKAQREQAAFAEVNFQDLKRNMAAGGGEYLSSFASLLGCSDSGKQAFAQMSQDRFEVILPTSKTGPIEMLNNVKAEIKASPALSSACSDERAIARAEGKDLPAPTMTLAKK
ncbi:MAG: DUF3015 domain-containing protein [Deltaproteobacteria bacterium]|nr:DUF3015 domain-containing protein [Deltaproteobacteria bacterium]